MPMKKSAIDKLLKEPQIAVIAATAPDGAPHAVPTWYEYRAGEIVFHTAASAFKYKCLAHDPRIALVVDTRKAPYKCVILKGRVTMTEAKDDARLKRMAVHYLGKRTGEKYAQAMGGGPVVIVRMKPDRVISWDYSQERP
ncbi:MAG TPA: PPOX class F420-dependent oxidoreductase [Candidatus Binataceae bacterium]|nr:PPOX class F420-dependent oxidoreductase [Candidatus Binataceae bacterium]